MSIENNSMLMFGCLLHHLHIRFHIQLQTFYSRMISSDSFDSRWKLQIASLGLVHHTQSTLVQRIQ